MTYRLFDPADPPAWLDSEWWRQTDNCNHLDNRVHRARLEAAAGAAVQCAQAVPTRTIVDLGAGDGGLLSLLPPEFREASFGYEVIEDSCKYALEVRGVEVLNLNVLSRPFPGNPVFTATEMLEHLADPGAFLVYLTSRPKARYLVASSPHSETQEHHEWNHAWAWDRPGYRALFEDNGWAVVRHFDAEWSQIVVAEVAS